LRGSRKDADLAAQAIAAELGGLPDTARRTITHDNGGEFARHQTVTEAIGLRATSVTRTAPGSAAGSKRPTAVSGATLRARPASRITPSPTSTTSSGTATQRPENASVTKPRSKPSPPTSVSHLKYESSRHQKRPLELAHC
jgi:hypothetical protein